jgi:hypothetical protein
MLRASIYLLWVLLLCGAASAADQTPHRVKPQKAAAKPSPAQAQSAATAPTPPTPDVTPEHGPSSPPQVSLQGGQLTIVARNSTMSDVLNAVRQKTGANVDMPAGSGERVVGQFGPGAPRDVMAQLLNGSHYDYVLLGSAADPHALNKIVLMAKSNGPEPAPTSQANQQQGENENLQAVPEVENENPVENGGEATPNMQEQPQEEPQPDQGDQSQDQQNGPVVKTPEQLLRELQQQQQNQSGPPGAPGQPPQ